MSFAILSVSYTHLDVYKRQDIMNVKSIVRLNLILYFGICDKDTKIYK